MSARRKRPVVLRPLSRLSGRDAVWAAIRALAARSGQHFTVRDILRSVVSGPDLVRDYLGRLVAAGIVAVIVPARLTRPAVYRLLHDRGVEAPRVNAAGEIDDAPTDQERIWQAMKALPSFDARDLRTATGIASETTVRSYVAHLARAGYLAVVVPEVPGRKGRLARYRLLHARNTGPRPPAIRRGKIVFDANLGRQVWPEMPA
jgi:hypothetical protein